MKPDPYYLDLDALPLDRLQRRLEQGKVLPGRTVLLQEITERFDLLRSLGIRSIGSLIAALKTKNKIQAFARRSGLPLDYLVILGREARAYVPKLVYLRDIPEIDPVYVDRLAAMGIKHSKHLFDRGQTVADRNALSEQSGVPRAALLELVQLADLARIGGLGPAFVRLFYQAGAESIAQLAEWSPEALWERAHAVNEIQKYTRVVPGLHDVRNYVAKAQELPKAIEYGTWSAVGGGTMSETANQGDGGFKIVARVIRQEGHCAAGHQVGDEIVFDGQTVEGKVCIHALYSFLPKVFAMRYGAQFPWLEDPDVATHACPDAWNPVVFEIRRIRE